MYLSSPSHLFSKKGNFSRARSLTATNAIAWLVGTLRSNKSAFQIKSKRKTTDIYLWKWNTCSRFKKTYQTKIEHRNNGWSLVLSFFQLKNWAIKFESQLSRAYCVVKNLDGARGFIIFIFAHDDHVEKIRKNTISRL